MASCLGSNFSYQTLSMVSKAVYPDEEITEDILTECIYSSYLVQIKFQSTNSSNRDMSSGVIREYSFAHDKIQQASGMLFASEKEKANANLKMAVSILSTTNFDEQSTLCFFAVSNLNSARDLLDLSDEDLLKHIEWNIKAAEYALRSIDADQALAFCYKACDAAQKIGEEKMWKHKDERYYRCIHSTYLQKQKLEYICLNAAESDKSFEKLRDNSRTIIDKFQTYDIKLHFQYVKLELQDMYNLAKSFLDEYKMFSIDIRAPPPLEDMKKIYSNVKDIITASNFEAIRSLKPQPENIANVEIELLRMIKKATLLMNNGWSPVLMTKIIELSITQNLKDKK